VTTVGTFELPSSGADVVVAIADRVGVQTVVVIRTPSTGEANESKLIGRNGLMTQSLIYEEASMRGGVLSPPRPLEDHAEKITTGDGPAIIFIDPAHVHDCLPDPALVTPTQRRLEWCGSTPIAFREVARAAGRAWLTVDCDFGIGILCPVSCNVVPCLSPEVEQRWAEASLRKRHRLFSRYGPDLMNRITPSQLDMALDVLIEGRTFHPTQLSWTERRRRRVRHVASQIKGAPGVAISRLRYTMMQHPRLEEAEQKLSSAVWTRRARRYGTR
jgi:hypothetical protein